jgi:hypothetical protein
MNNNYYEQMNKRIVSLFIVKELTQSTADLPAGRQGTTEDHREFNFFILCNSVNLCGTLCNKKDQRQSGYLNNWFPAFSQYSPQYILGVLT